MAEERFDPLAAGKEEDTVRGYLRRYQTAGEQMRAHGVKHALDAACGTGHGTSELSYFIPKVVGVDLAKEAMRICRQRHGANKRTSFQRGDLERWEIPNCFDGIASIDTIEHLRDPQGFIRRMQRHAKIVVVAWPLKSGNNRFHLSAITEDQLRGWFSRWTLIHYHYEPEDARRYMMTAWSRPRG